MARIFKTGSTLITESAEMQGLDNEQIRALLKHAYPEVVHATIREREDGENTVIEFLPKIGTKGQIEQIT